MNIEVCRFFVTLYFRKLFFLLMKQTGSPCFNGFYMKMNLPQYVITVTNIFRYETNILSKECDILSFTSILCIFFRFRCPTSEEHFFLKQINSESLFWLIYQHCKILAWNVAYQISSIFMKLVAPVLNWVLQKSCG